MTDLLDVRQLTRQARPNDDMRRGRTVLAHLMTVNTGMGRAVQHMHDYEAEHGHLPPDQLRTLAVRLHKVAAEPHEYAEQLDRPMIQVITPDARRLGSGRP